MDSARHCTRALCLMCLFFTARQDVSAEPECSTLFAAASISFSCLGQLAQLSVAVWNAFRKRERKRCVAYPALKLHIGIILCYGSADDQVPQCLTIWVQSSVVAHSHQWLACEGLLQYFIHGILHYHPKVVQATVRCGTSCTAVAPSFSFALASVVPSCHDLALNYWTSGEMQVA